MQREGFIGWNLGVKSRERYKQSQHLEVPFDYFKVYSWPLNSLEGCCHDPLWCWNSACSLQLALHLHGSSVYAVSHPCIQPTTDCIILRLYCWKKKSVSGPIQFNQHYLRVNCIGSGTGSWTTWRLLQEAGPELHRGNRQQGGPSPSVKPGRMMTVGSLGRSAQWVKQNQWTWLEEAG